MIHLDTNFLIQALVPNSAAEAKLQIWLRDGEALGISAVAWSEFLCGPLTANDAALAEVLFDAPEPFLGPDAYKAAELFNETGRRSRSLADCQIAAVALRCNALLATGDVSDFAMFQSHGLTYRLSAITGSSKCPQH
jgi:predicted nucleic acid-binding protein